MIVISRRKPDSILLQDRAIIAHFYHSIFLIVQEITRELPCDFIFISKHQQTGSSRVVFFRQMYEFLSKQKNFYPQLAISRDGDSDSSVDSLSVTRFFKGYRCRIGLCCGSTPVSRYCFFPDFITFSDFG